jgi:hypothetical protein
MARVVEVVVVRCREVPCDWSRELDGQGSERHQSSAIIKTDSHPRIVKRAALHSLQDPSLNPTTRLHAWE